MKRIKRNKDTIILVASDIILIFLLFFLKLEEGVVAFVSIPLVSKVIILVAIAVANIVFFMTPKNQNPKETILKRSIYFIYFLLGIAAIVFILSDWL